MHISHFKPGDIIRHRDFQMGVEYARVAENNTYEDRGTIGPTMGHMVILLQGRHRQHVASKSPTWRDGGSWDLVSAEWFTENGYPVPEALIQDLQPTVTEIKPDKGWIGTSTTT